MSVQGIWAQICPVLAIMRAIKRLLCVFRLQAGFRNYNYTWKVALTAILKRNAGREAPSTELALGVRQRFNPRKRVRRNGRRKHLSCVMDKDGVCVLR